MANREKKKQLYRKRQAAGTNHEVVCLAFEGDQAQRQSWQVVVRNRFELKPGKKSQLVVEEQEFVLIGGNSHHDTAQSAMSPMCVADQTFDERVGL